MKLQDFLKVKKVRCFIGDATVTTGRVYDVVGLDKAFIHVIDDNGEVAHYWYSRFEPVLDMSKSAPEIDTSADSVDNCQAPHVSSPSNNDASHSKFKAGDKVYYRGDEEIYVVSDVSDFGDVQIKYWREDYHNSKYFCHATQENYERLQATFPDIEFEQPPKSLTGSDLCRAMLEKGWVSVPCYISDESDYEADNNAFCALIGKFDKCFKELATNYEHEYAVPFDPRTGEVLTETVLDE